jgi:hypothetical protein
MPDGGPWCCRPGFKNDRSACGGTGREDNNLAVRLGLLSDRWSEEVITE